MNRREALRLLACSGGSLASLGGLSSLLNGCAHLRQRERVKSRDKYGVTILVDGWRADRFRDMLDAGELPNIKKHLVDRGTLVEDCVGTFPSTSGPAHVAIVNGIMPGPNNTPGIRWVDRRNNIVRDYCTLETIFFNNDFPKENRTIYEMLAGERTVCIFDFVSRGASEFIRPTFEWLWFSRREKEWPWRQIDQDAVKFFIDAFNEDPIPTYSFVWLPAIDHLSHMRGTNDDAIQRQSEIIDEQVGLLMDALRKRGVYDKTLVTLTADHGLRDTHNNMDIRRPLEQAGFKVLRDLAGNDEYNALVTHDAARAVSGNGFALLYFAKKKRKRLLSWIAWEDRVPFETPFEELFGFPTLDGNKVDLIDLLRNEPAVKFLMAMEKDEKDEPDPGIRWYRMFTRDGEARIKRDETTRDLKYSVVSGPDPLGYSDHPATRLLMDDQFHDKDVWFEHSTGTDYPDAPFQISQIFDSERCGDIVASSAPGWDFMNQDHEATHGGLEKEEMMVPCVVAGPEVKRGEVIPRARTVDLFPMYLEFFGIPELDGQVPNVFKE